jgi:DNA-directed RNA polymerase specialized sigma24 family protein
LATVGQVVMTSDRNFVSERRWRSGCKTGGIKMSRSKYKCAPEEAAFTEKWLLDRIKEVRGYLRRHYYSGHAIEQAVTVLYRAAMPYIKGTKVWEIECPRAWSFKVAKRAAYRAAEREMRFTSVEPALLAATAVDTGPGEELFDIRDALKQLTEKQRTAVELCFLGEMSRRGAAKVMHVSASTVQAYLIAGKERLKEILPALLSPSLRKHYLPNAPALYPDEGGIVPLQTSPCSGAGSDGGDSDKEGA